MIDLKQLRAAPEQVRSALARRGDKTVLALLDEIETLDTRRRALTGELDALKAARNASARADAQHIKAHGALPPEIVKERKRQATGVAEHEANLKTVEAELDAKAMFVPNLPLPELPSGDATHNATIRTWGQATPKGGRPHWEIAEQLHIVDFARGAKVSGSGFVVFTGAGARLCRSLINFMLDLHTTQHGYLEIEPPALVRRAPMEGTGQLPKFADEAYAIPSDDLFLIPTAEVPVTNLHRDEILEAERLPLAYTAYTPCFRREAGAAGKDTRGLLRVHQFDKVELVRICGAAQSPVEHERLTAHAEAVLQGLELPYRVLLLAAGDLGFASAKTYDLEAWAPGVGQWLEVSSSSTFTDFQARRANIRARRGGDKPEFVHTLNASGVALPRTIAALLETHAQPDGSVLIPRALTRYFGADRLVPPATSSGGA